LDETVFYVVTLADGEFSDFLADAYGEVVPFDPAEAIEVQQELEYVSGYPAAVVQ